MERLPNKIPDAILCSDIHLREDTPVCYTGDYQKEQWQCVNFISDLQKKYNCPVLCGGDLFNKSNPSLNLVRETILHIPDKFFVIYGQHDLPSHSIELSHKCGIDLLSTAGSLTILTGTHFGQEPDYENNLEGHSSFIIKGSNYRRILVWHKLAYQTIPFLGATGGNAKELLKKYPQFDLILTGDNHCTFVEEYQGRILVNPGSMMRMTAAQIDHKPCVFLWYADTNTVVPVYLPIQEGIISREHIEVKEERNERIDAFVSKLNTNYKLEISFEENLTQFFEVNNTEEDIKKIVYKSIEI